MTIPDWSALPLLAAAVLLFLLSTQQWPLWGRAPIWLAGVAALAAAAWPILSDNMHYGVLQSIADQARRPALFLTALRQNAGTIESHIVPMFGAFWALGVVVAIFAMFALTPGEAIERGLRPFAAATIGAIGGGVLVLGLVAIGFDGGGRQAVYVGRFDERTVIDGDTIRFGYQSLRIDGIAAPEDRSCYGDAPADCGGASTRALRALLHDKFFLCRKPARLGEKPGHAHRDRTTSRPMLHQLRHIRSN